METYKNKPAITAPSLAAWRAWLKAHHHTTGVF